MRREPIQLGGWLPPFMAESRELRAAFAAEEPEFERAWGDAERLLRNQFAATADGEGLARYEKLLHIRAQAGETLPARRARVLAALRQDEPYTHAWLCAWLDGLLGKDGHAETVEDYTLTLRLDGAALGAAHLAACEVAQMLYDILPAQMLLRCTVVFDAQCALRAGGAFGAQVHLPVPGAAQGKGEKSWNMPVS